MHQTSKRRLTLERGQIYGWTMYPRYFDHPYRSPVLIDSIEPLGQRTYKMMFLNMFYAAGVQDMAYTLRTLRRDATFIVAEQIEEGKLTDRVVIIEPMNARWITNNVTQLSQQLRDLFDDYGRPIENSFRKLMAGSASEIQP